MGSYFIYSNSHVFKVAPKGWSDASIFVELPFMHQMGYTCLVTLALIAFISYLDGNKDDSKE
jgi:SSS family solute:Na+ symporter